MIQLCRHIFRDNRQCSQPAANRTFYCRHHRDTKDWKRRSGLHSQIRTQTPTQTYDHGTMLVPDREPTPPYPVDLEFPEDPAAILTNIYRVTSMLVRGQIDRPTANSVTYGMQVCLSALNGKPLFEPATAAPSRSRSRDTDSDADSEGSNGSESGTPVSRPVHRVILTPDGDEIAPPVEILEDNEAEPIHHKACPCLECAEKYRNQPPEEHHPDCQCGLCEEQSAEHSTQSTELPNEIAHFRSCHPERSAPRRTESRDLLFSESGTIEGSDTPDEQSLSPVPCSLSPELSPELCALSPRPRVARAVSLLSGSPSRDPLNRPWSVAEYTFGDAIRRHEAQYAARAAAALAVGIEPPPYQPYTTGLIPPGTPEHEEDQQMQQHSSEYWAAHFRKQIAERPDIQPGVPTDGSSSVGWKQYLDEEQASEAVPEF
ncbi:MAG: hypothetical protein JO300_01555 [Silvibacterium sp.]|nr:hypothetical protein [Silvibacterium sp.]